MDEKGLEWGKFSSELLGYIDEGVNRFVKTDYDVHVNMSPADILQELQEKNSIEELSPELQRVAREFIVWKDNNTTSQ